MDFGDGFCSSMGSALGRVDMGLAGALLCSTCSTWASDRGNKAVGVSRVGLDLG